MPPTLSDRHVVEVLEEGSDIRLDGSLCGGGVVIPK